MLLVSIPVRPASKDLINNELLHTLSLLCCFVSKNNKVLRFRGCIWFVFLKAVRHVVCSVCLNIRVILYIDAGS